MTFKVNRDKVDVMAFDDNKLIPTNILRLESSFFPKNIPSEDSDVWFS